MFYCIYLVPPLAHKLYRHFADTVANKGSPEVRELEQISSLEDLTQSSLAEKFR